MSATVQTKTVEERHEILLTLALAFCQKKGAADLAIETLSALNDADLEAVRTKSRERLSDEEKLLRLSRIEQRIFNRAEELLDADVHPTQIAAVLQSEPDYIRRLILRRLPPEMGAEAAFLLNISIASTENENISPGLEGVLRRVFRANFVSRDALGSPLPPDALVSGAGLLELIQRLGRREIALVCRGIREIENLAPFLRQFADADAKAIVEQLANLGAVEQKRIRLAENLVQAAWRSETENALVPQLLGIWKLTEALAAEKPVRIRYTVQKLPVRLAAKFQERLETIFKTENAGLFAAEIEMFAVQPN